MWPGLPPFQGCLPGLSQAAVSLKGSSEELWTVPASGACRSLAVPGEREGQVAGQDVASTWDLLHWDPHGTSTQTRRPSLPVY